MSLPRDIPRTNELTTPAPLRQETAHTDKADMLAGAVNELSNFAQSFVYSTVERPAAAVTQVVDAVAPNLLPHFEVTQPSQNDSFGSFLGNAAGNFVDLLVLGKISRMPAVLGRFNPILQVGSSTMMNSLLTPVNVAPGESIWGKKLTSAGTDFAFGAIGRGVMGKLYSGPMRDVDYAIYGVAGIEKGMSATYDLRSQQHEK